MNISVDSDGLSSEPVTSFGFDASNVGVDVGPDLDLHLDSVGIGSSFQGLDNSSGFGVNSGLSVSLELSGLYLE